MKTITFKELIELIEKNEQPEVIWTSIHKFEWDEITENYYSRDDKGLLVYHTLGELVVEQIQIPTKSLLTDEEKAYLKAVIEPVKENVFSIRRQSGTLYIHISVTATMTFNLKTFIYKFSGLKEEKSYKLSDLDLG